jgi:hypothetical protein
VNGQASRKGWAGLVPLTLLIGACAPTTEVRRLSFPPVSHQRLPVGETETRLHGVATTFGGQVPVFVGRHRTAQVLHLTSIESALWHVYLLPGSKVRTIYVSGLEPQGVAVHAPRGTWRPKRPQIINLGTNLRSHETLSFGPPMNFSGPRARAYVEELKRVTGLPLSAFTARDFVAPGQALMLTERPIRTSTLTALFPSAFRRVLRAPLAEWNAIQRDIGMLIERGDLPSHLPVWDADTALPAKQLSFWPLLPDAGPTTAQPGGKLCGRYQLGTDGHDLLWCDELQDRKANKASTLWAVAGGGRDVLIDRHLASQVMSGGRGDDIITAGGGNDILHFGRNWGNDIVSARCFLPDIPGFWGGTPPEPRHQNSSFLIFGRGVRPSDLRWIGSTELENRRTGDRIRFNEGPCYHFRAVEPGKIPVPPSPD